MFQYFVLALTLIFAGWLFWKILVFAASLVISPAELMIMPFEANETQKKQGRMTLSAKLRELKTRGKVAPTTYGLISVPLLESGPRQAELTADTALAELDKIQLKIKDVDVSAIIRVFDALLTPARYELRGSVIDLPTSLSVTCELVRREEVIASWEANAKKTAAPDGAQSAGPPNTSFEELLDQVLYQIVFYLLKDEKLKNEWKISIADPDRFANWQSLRAYVRGLRALRLYQENLDTKDLQEAQNFFDALTISDPSNPYGFYFRGLALSEDRKEAEAIESFSQLQRLLDRQGNADKGKAMSREARLNEATSRLKLYRSKEADKAVEILRCLIDELKIEPAPPAATANGSPGADASPPAPPPIPITAENAYSAKLLTLCYAQLAYTHGTILSFLEGKAVVPGPDSPESHAVEMNNNLKLARDTFDSLKNFWASSREKLDVQFRIDNAEGYGLYRNAYFEAKKSSGVDDKKDKESTPYQKLCRTAIGYLEKANEARPNHYEVLQNLAMIYADEDFDPEGNSLPEAQRLFERTTKFVPNDYYQYEQLAKIHGRLLELCSTDECRKEQIDAGIKAAKNAIKLRSQSVTALQTLVQLGVKKWEIEKHDNTVAAAALEAFQNAMPFRKENPKFQDEYIRFLENLAPTRKSSASGLNELVERAIALLRLPTLGSEQRTRLTKFASEKVDESLSLSGNKPENAELKNRGDQLKRELNELPKADAPAAEQSQK